MKDIAILVTEQALIAAIGNARYLFTRVNDYLQESGKQPVFDVKLVGKEKNLHFSNGPFTIQADATLAEVKEAELIIIPPMSGDMKASITSNRECISWMLQQYQKGAEIASLCVGAFLLAETGLLKNRTCSTHWVTANEFEQMFPDVILVDEKVITDQDGLYTSGGANSYWNLLIYLVEKFTDRETAIYASKYFAIDRDRKSQSAFRIFEGSKLHKDERILEAQQYIEQHYRDRFTVKQLSKRAHLSQRTFQRRFKEATHFPVHTYLQKIRMEVAKRMLESEGLTINEIMFDVGYQDPKAFRNIFKKETGISPSAYRHKYL